MKKIILLLIATFMGYTVIAQVSINTDGAIPDASAMLDVKSTDKGLLPPRVANVNDVSNPVAGLLVYDLSLNCMRYYNGTVWSECMGRPFICGDPFIDSRDGQSYTTVQIGTQCWMAENLNVGTRIDGANDQTDNSTIEKHCYNDLVSNCDIYGGIYQWDEMMQYVTTEGVQGICPDGWYLPSDDEWKTMEMALGMTQVQADAEGWRGTDEGEKLKSTSGWYNSGNGTNSSGFTALPGGGRSSSGSFDFLGDLGGWWSSTESSGADAWYRSLYYDYGQVGRFSDDKTYGLSVRCLKN